LYLFIIVALSIYTVMHLVAYWGMRPLLVNHPAVPSLVVAWMALMTAAPFAVRFLERQGFELAARGVAWVGYTWMGFLFLAFSLFACIGAVELILFVAGRFAPALADLTIHGAVTATLACLLVLGVGLYGIYEAKCLTVERVELTSEKLTPSQSIRIAQVSDLHLGLMLREEVLAPVVLKLAELKPDLIVATGDVVDAQINHIDELIELWRQIDAPLGKYAILGNHETYAGVAQSMEFLQNSGFTVLRNEARELGEALTLIGLDYERHAEEPVLMGGQDNARYKVVLKHVPTVRPDVMGLFDLQLSGHTHKGQIFPFNLITGMKFPMLAGLYRLSGGSNLYTSRGTGTWGPPMRVGAPPEITLIEIKGR
jgi:predicted MPP superfamily phosphohydrolase